MFLYYKKGYVCNFHISIGGKECIIGLLSNSDIIGLTNVFLEKQNNVFSKALTEVTVISIPGKNLNRL